MTKQKKKKKTQKKAKIFLPFSLSHQHAENFNFKSSILHEISFAHIEMLQYGGIIPGGERALGHRALEQLPRVRQQVQLFRFRRFVATTGERLFRWLERKRVEWAGSELFLQEHFPSVHPQYFFIKIEFLLKLKFNSKNSKKFKFKFLKIFSTFFFFFFFFAWNTFHFSK